MSTVVNANIRTCTTIMLVSIAIVIVDVGGHGMMLKPPNRSSLWRFDPDSPKNYNDNQNYCGGFTVQWNQHHGKCGVCGDNYADQIPRDNENTGYYGRGKVVAEYQQGTVIDVDILLTANHIGYFNYSLCRLEDPTKPETDECFFYLQSPNGDYKFWVNSQINHYTNQLQLPNDFLCDRCVLRWNYRAGNSWGDCGNGTGAIGCGPQEHFRSCSDIRIVRNIEFGTGINLTLIDDLDLRPYIEDDLNAINNNRIDQELTQPQFDYVDQLSMTNEEQEAVDEDPLIQFKYSLKRVYDHLLDNNVDEDVMAENNNNHDEQVVEKKTVDILQLLKNRHK